jgi:hypothetical protein
MNLNIKLLDQLRDLAHDELLNLANWCQSEATKKDPVKLAYEKQLQESMTKYQAEQDRKNAEEQALVVKLKAFIKPVMRLKMKGCKDGAGLREFIRWDGNNLVCWQIKRIRRGWSSAGTSKVEEINTNFVTTHMADKVQRIFVDGTGLQVKSILK